MTEKIIMVKNNLNTILTASSYIENFELLT